MPTHVLAGIFHLHGKITIQPAVNYAVVTDSPVTIQTQPREVDNQRVSGHGGLNIKRPGFRISAHYALHAFFICAASIHRGGVDGISGPDGEHGFVPCRELAIKSCGRKFMPLGRPGAALRDELRRELVGRGMRGIVAVSDNKRSGHGVVLECRLALYRSALLVFGHELQGRAADRPFELSAGKVAGNLVSLLLQRHVKVAWSAIKISADRPASGNCRRGLGRSGSLREQKGRGKKQKKDEPLHDASSMVIHFRRARMEVDRWQVMSQWPDLALLYSPHDLRRRGFSGAAPLLEPQLISSASGAYCCQPSGRV